MSGVITTDPYTILEGQKKILQKSIQLKECKPQPSRKQFFSLIILQIQSFLMI